MGLVGRGGTETATIPTSFPPPSPPKKNLGVKLVVAKRRKHGHVPAKGVADPGRDIASGGEDATAGHVGVEVVRRIVAGPDHKERVRFGACNNSQTANTGQHAPSMATQTNKSYQQARRRTVHKAEGRVDQNPRRVAPVVAKSTGRATRVVSGPADVVAVEAGHRCLGAHHVLVICQKIQIDQRETG